MNYSILTPQGEIGSSPNRAKAISKARRWIEGKPIGSQVWVERDGERFYSATVNVNNRVSVKSAPKSLPRIPTKEETLRLIMAPDNSWRGIRDQVAMWLMYRVGLRVSEVANLSRRDIDFVAKMLMVRKGKGGKDRALRFDQETLDWLLKWDKIRPKGQRFICKQNGESLTTRALQLMVRKYSEQVGIYIDDDRPVHPHTLRHRCLTDLVNDGMPIHQAQDYAGHSSIQTTQVYLHVAGNEIGEFMDNRKAVMG